MLNNIVPDVGWLYSYGVLVSWYTNVHLSPTTIYSITDTSYIK